MRNILISCHESTCTVSNAVHLNSLHNPSTWKLNDEIIDSWIYPGFGSAELEILN